MPPIPTADFEGRLMQTGDAQAARAYLRQARETADARFSRTVAPLERAAVIGAGAMGLGIAMTLADAGLSVQLLDAEPQRLAQALAGAAAEYGRAVVKGRITPAEAEARLARIVATRTLAEIRPVDIAIEAVFEDIDLKRRIMAELDAILPEGAILATNTSTLDIDRIAAATRRPQDVVGAHFFIPAQVTGLIEIVRGQATSEATLDRIGALAKRLGKAAVVARVCDGFIGNRMFDQFWRQAMFLAETGAKPRQVDAALEAWGFAIGPFRTLDMIGNELPWGTIRKRAGAKSVGVQPRSYDLICESGRSGQKAGKGWYRYEPGDRKPIDDPDVEMLIERAAVEFACGAPPGVRRGNRRPLRLRPGQRGRATARRGRRREGIRRRPDVGRRLWFSSRARRPAVLRAAVRLAAHSPVVRELRPGAWRSRFLAAGAAADASMRQLNSAG